MIQQTTYAVPRADLGVAFHEYSPTRVRMIARDILPILNVGKEAATISVTRRENANIPETKHANGTAYGRVELYMEDMPYACVDHGLEGQVTDRDRAKFADDFDAELEKTAAVKVKMLLAREKRVKNLIFNTTTWTGTALYTDNSGSPWDNIATDIIDQIGKAKEKVRLNTGVPANALIIGEAAMQNMLKNTKIIARFPGTAVITEAILRAAMAAIFGLQDLIVGQAAYNSADEGLAASMTDMWGDDYAMVAALGAEGMPMSEPQLGRTILWQSFISDIEYVESYREEQTKSDIIRVEHSVDEKVFDKYFGHLMKIDVL